MGYSEGPPQSIQRNGTSPMASVPSLSASLQQRVSAALAAAVPSAEGADPLLRRSDRADFQANGVLGLAKRNKANPRELAAQVVAGLPADDVIADVEVSGPGFLNITVGDRAITANLAARAADDRLGVPFDEAPGTTVIDYSQPNVAKEMHVGHLRSTVIGDALVKILEFRGETVIRRHHIGDWGTQFGMLIQYLIEHPHELDHSADEATAGEAGEASMSRLNRLYKASRALFDSDTAFRDRARRRVVDLQAGDEETLALWQRFVDESKIYFYSVYEKLDVRMRDEDIVGESAYNDMLAETCKLLEDSGVAVRSDGALCVFFDDVKAKANVATLQAAMPIVGYYESIVASLTELAGDNLGKSLYSMFKAFDPTRSENKAMRTLWQVVPGGGAALTAVDSAAMVNKAVNAAKKAVPTPVKPAAAQAKPAPAPAKVIVAPIANQPKPVIVNDEKLRAVSDAILDDMVKAALNGTGYADMRPDQMVPMLPALIKEQKRRADLRALVQSPALQAYNPAPATPEGRRRWYSPKRRGLYANGAGL